MFTFIAGGVVFLAVLGLPVASAAFEPPGCAATIADLRTLVADASFPLRWEETSMADGKPLIVSIMEKDGSILLGFVKTGEGLWAEGAARDLQIERRSRSADENGPRTRGPGGPLDLAALHRARRHLCAVAPRGRPAAHCDAGMARRFFTEA